MQLGNIVKVVRDKGPTEIGHYARQRQIIVNANLQGKPLGTAVEDVNAIAARGSACRRASTSASQGMAEIME